MENIQPTYQNNDMFWSTGFIKLRQIDNSEFCNEISEVLMPNETVLYSFKSARDGILFTNERIICIDLTGITGKSKRFSFIHYSIIQAYSVHTPGVLDVDSSLSVWGLGIGKITFGFWATANIFQLCGVISQYISGRK